MAGGSSRHRKQVSCREYYSYLLQMGEQDGGEDALLLYCGRATHQYVVDMYVKLENTRLDFFRNNQDTVRADLYHGVLDAGEAGEQCASNIGHRVILLPSFIGGPRDMRRRYLNAMALVRKYGKPDVFITMTCNTNWKEIQAHLQHGQHAHNRPDLIARVFRAKLVYLKKLIMERLVLGEVAAYFYVVEFQKRGLPHAHILVILKAAWKLRCPEEFDRFVSCELPPVSQPALRALVIKHMMHGPCGDLDPTCGCMREKNGQTKCRFGYPKPYSDYTTTNDEGYPAYRRRQTDDFCIKKGVKLDNRWVIPYNPFLLAELDCHINVEICSNAAAVKYLYKYIYKGHDRVSFSVGTSGGEGPVDEIAQFQDGRWISPPEAAWRIFGFPLYEMYPPVIPLQVHLPNMQSISFCQSESVPLILSDEVRSRTPLTEFFKVNSQRAGGEKHLYPDFPEYFTWNGSSKSWQDRKKGVAVGRMAFVGPGEFERFHLRLLLASVRGPASFEELLTVNGQICSSFQQTAIQRGLVEDSGVVERCLDEALVIQMSSTLRRLFTSLLIFCNPPNPKELWDKYYTYLSEDIRHSHTGSEPAVLAIVARQMLQMFESMGRTLEEFGLEHLQESIPLQVRVIRDIQDIMEAPIPQEFLDAKPLLNERQREAYKCIMRCVKEGHPGLFFIDGPGGTGKTFLYNVLYAKARKLGKIVLPTASSGIAASNLPCGRTAHSRFKLPIDLDASLSCNVPKQGALAALLLQTTMIFWDEATMAHKLSIQALDLLLRDVCGTDTPFGGKVMVLGGDFRQVLPVLPNKSQQDAIEASFVSSSLWPLFTRFKLTENMRAKEDPEFAEFLLALGDGRLQTEEIIMVSIPSDMLLSFEAHEDPINILLNNIFPEILSPPFDPAIFIERAILAPKNEEVDLINDSFIERFPGEAVSYQSIDKLVDEVSGVYPVEYLNLLTPSGMSPHDLVLKKECPVMLLRNIDPSAGLCNGTRMVCKAFSANLVLCEVATGFAKGNQVMIHRIHMKQSSGSQLPFKFQRTQFPLKLSFAMTINKSQGQTLDKVGVYLRHHCFGHGHLYVAVSRGQKSSNVKVISESNSSTSQLSKVKNVVSYEVLRRSGTIA